LAGLDRTAHGNGARSQPPPTFVIRAPIRRSDLAGLGERLLQHLRACGARLLLCDVAGLLDPDAETVDALARIQLIGQREGASVYFRGASLELRELLEFVGLVDLLEMCL
jgi:hypothetical protein